MAQRGRKPKRYENVVLPRWDDIMEAVKKGANNKELAVFIGIGEGTIYDYFNAHPEFKQAIEDARRKTVVEVKNALLKRALGYSYKEIKRTRKVKNHKENEEGETEEFVEVSEKEVPPDPRAISMYLRNYDPDWVETDGFSRRMKEEEMKLKQQLAEKDIW